MAITRDQAKQYFLTGKYPTQAQFHALLDALLFSGEVAVGDIFGLTTILQNKVDVSQLGGIGGGGTVDAELRARIIPQAVTGGADERTFTLSAGYMLDVVGLYADHDCTVTAGFTSGAADLVPGFDLVGGKWNAIQINYFAQEDTVLYFNGVATVSQLKFFKR